MYVGIYIYMYVCIYMYICKYENMKICIHVNLYNNKYIQYIYIYNIYIVYIR